MGLMQKLRSSTKYIIWLVIISFGLLWGLSDTQVFDAMMTSPRDMAEVNKEPISWAEFNQRVSLLTEQHREHTGVSPDREIRAHYEEMAWEQLVIDKILRQKMQDIGIQVADSELVEMVTGDDPDPFIRQQFTRDDGTIDRVALQNAIEAPENREIWLMIEQQLREQRRQEKLQHYIEASVQVSDYEIEEEYKKRNSYAEFHYVRFPYFDISRDEIEISDSEIRSYYRDNEHRFQRNKSWNFSYVTFPVEATPEDTARARYQLADLRQEFRETDDIPGFLDDYRSETDYFDSFLKPSEVRREHLKAFEMEIDEVSEPYVSDERVHMIRLLEERPSDETYVRVRQIWLDDEEEDMEDLLDDAEHIMNRVHAGQSFEQLAKLHSHDEHAGYGGELGYIERDDKPEELSDAIFNASPGSIIGPITHRDGIFIFQILDRTNKEIRFADMSLEIEPDPFETVQYLANEAEDFQFFAMADGFFDEARRSNYSLEEAVATEGQPFIPELGQSRIILNALEQMESGDISDVIETEEYFLVLHVDEVIPEGTRPLDEVRSQIESTLRDKKRQELLVRRVNEMLNDNVTLEALAEKSEKTIQHAEDVRFSEPNIPVVGREPKVVGTAFSLPVGERSSAIPGNNAVFVMMVNHREMADVSAMTMDKRREIREELQEQKNEAFGRVWAERLKADADIRDFRTRQIMQPPM